MPAYNNQPYTPTKNQFLKGKSLFHWCPNTHLHSRRRMYVLYERYKGLYGKLYTLKEGWYCPECSLLEYKDYL